MTTTNTPDPADELLNRFMGQIFTNDNRLNHHEQSPEEHGYREKVYRAEAKAAIQTAIRTEQKKLLAAVMERVIGKDDIQVMDSDEVMDTKFCSTCGLIDTEEYEFECTCQRKNELRAEQRAVLQQIMEELDHNV